MTTFPTPSQSTTVNSLNIVSPSELQDTLQAKTAIALDDGSPRAYDLKALDNLAQHNEGRIYELEVSSNLQQADISQLQAQIANEASSGLQLRIIELEYQLAQLQSEYRLLEDRMHLLETTQPKGYIYGQWRSDERSKSPAELWPNSVWVELKIAGQVEENSIWLSI